MHWSVLCQEYLSRPRAPPPAEPRDRRWEVREGRGQWGSRYHSRLSLEQLKSEQAPVAVEKAHTYSIKEAVLEKLRRTFDPQARWYLQAVKVSVALQTPKCPLGVTHAERLGPYPLREMDAP